MSIMGNVVGLAPPRADWAQEDSTRGDYIRNKPDFAAMEQTAREALEKASSALPLTGGSLTGNVDMDGNRLTGLGNPTGDTDAVTRKYMAEQLAQRHRLFGGTLTPYGWAGEAAPYTQQLLSSGILESDAPHITPVYDASNALAQREAWGMVSYAVAGSGVITFTCLEEKPAAAIPIQIEVTRG